MTSRFVIILYIFFPFPCFFPKALRHWTRYGKQTALYGRYHSNCLLLWFALDFRFLFLFCLLILTTQIPIGVKVAMKLQRFTLVSFDHPFHFVLSILRPPFPSGTRSRLIYLIHYVELVYLQSNSKLESHSASFTVCLTVWGADGSSGRQYGCSAHETGQNININMRY